MRWIPLLFLVACSTPGQAAFSQGRRDLRCEEAISENLPNNVFRVRGCGREATYTCGYTITYDGDRVRHCTRQGAVREIASGGENVVAPPRDRRPADPASAAAYDAVREQQSALMACHPNPPLLLNLRFLASGRIEGFSGSISTTEEETCLQAILATLEAQGLGRDLVLEIELPVAEAPPPPPASTPDPRGGPSTPPEPETSAEPSPVPSSEPAGASPEAVLRGLLRAQGPAALVCNGGASLALRATADETGAIRVALVGELAGGDVESCVQDVLRDLQAPEAAGASVLQVLR